MALYPLELRPQSPDDLVRIGAPFDGGYVVSRRMIDATKGLLSFGLSDEWEFEAKIAEFAKVPVVCFDPSVNITFWIKKFAAGLARGVTNLDSKRIRRGLRFIDYVRFFDGRQRRHIRKAIGYPGPMSLSFRDALKEASLPSPLLLKMDIEGWEYRVLPELLTARNSFTGLIIEFHDVDLHKKRIVEFVTDMSNRFVLIHFHANSHTTVGSDGLALVIELTFMARDLLKPREVLKTHTLPLAGLDAPNIPGDIEATVSFGAHV
jgi:hypothetical protein